MVTADVEELKTKLAEYLAKVKAGQDVLITEAGRPIARLEPATNGVRIRPPERPGPLPPEFFQNRIKDPEGLVLKALLEERAEGR